MKEFVTIASAFLVVVGLAFYMYVSNQKHSISIKNDEKIEEMMTKNDNEIRKEIQILKAHIYIIDSIYHKIK